MSEHALLSASKMSIWENCIGSSALWQQLSVPETSSSYAVEGTLAHLAAENVLSGHLDNASDFIPESPVGPDFHTAVNYYLDYVTDLLISERAACRRVHPDAEPNLLVEQKVSFERLGRKDLFGTVDCLIHTPGKKAALHIIDYKHGAGVPVDIISEDFTPNRQLMYYLLASIYFLANRYGDTIEGKGYTFANYLWDTYSSFHIHIVQPRVPGKGGDLRVTIDMLTQFRDEFFAAVKAAEFQHTCKPEDLTLKVGSWCRWCSVKDQCPAHLNKQLNETINDFEVLYQVDEVQSLDLDQLSELLLKAEEVKKTIRLLETHAEARLKFGDHIPNFKLIDKRGTKKWKSESQVKELLTAYGVNLIDILQLPSPSALLKWLPPNLSKDMKGHIEQTSSGTRLGRST